jgi:hypothetical protein
LHGFGTAQFAGLREHQQCDRNGLQLGGVAGKKLKLVNLKKQFFNVKLPDFAFHFPSHLLRHPSYGGIQAPARVVGLLAQYQQPLGLFLKFSTTKY